MTGVACRDVPYLGILSTSFVVAALCFSPQELTVWCSIMILLIDLNWPRLRSIPFLITLVGARIVEQIPHITQIFISASLILWFVHYEFERVLDTDQDDNGKASDPTADLTTNKPVSPIASI